MENEVENTNNELVEFFKALADANRLKLIGLLANQPQSGEQLASILGISPSTVSHHLSYLAHIGLVAARAEGYYSMYFLKTDVLENMARRLLDKKTLPSLAEDLDLDAYDRKVIKDFSLPDGTLKSFPAQKKKMDVILRYVVKDFETGKRFTEKQVNEILEKYHHDFATMRRGLIDEHLMARKNGEYWRVTDAI
jgi:biotin operon repressor